jgi:hypothetical protein
VSRSYRKPIATEGYGSKDKKQRKRLANKRARRVDVANGRAYRKVSNSWDICDFKFPITNGPDKKNRSK